MADLVRRTIVIAVMIVVVVVPVAIGMPTMLVFIPPTMSAAPAIFARFVQFAPSLIRLFAFAPMTLDRFMKMMIRPADAALAIVVIGAQTRSAGEEQESRQRGAGQHYFSDGENSRQKFGLHPVVSSILK
jgi:hypothetical protein